MKKLPWMILLGIAACTSDNRMAPITEKEISSAGGQIRSADSKAVLTFPANALSSPTRITINRVGKGDELFHPAISGDAVYEMGPDGQTFAEPVQLDIFGAAGKSMALAQVFSNRIEIVADSAYDPENNVVTGHLEHFSSYGVVSLYDACAGLSCGDSCTICDPADPSCIEPPLPRVCDRGLICAVAIPMMCTPPVTPDAGIVVPDVGFAPDSGLDPMDATVPVDPDASVFPTDSGPGPGDGGTMGTCEIEPNDNAMSANDTGLGLGSITTCGAIQVADDRDWFHFQVPPGMLASVHAITHTDPNDTTICASGGGADTFLTLFDAVGQTLATNDDNGHNFCSEISTTLMDGDYYFEVKHFSNTGVIPSYYFTLEIAGLIPSDGGASDGAISSDGGVFGGDGGGGGGTMDGGVRPDAGGGGGFFDAGGGGGTMDASTAPDAGGGGFFDAGSGGGSAVSEVEPNQPLANANAFMTTPGTTLQIGAAISPAGDEDYFVFSGGGAGLGFTVHAITHSALNNPNVCAAGTDTILELLDSMGNQIAWNDDNGMGMCSELEVPLAAGTYYFKVRAFAPPITIGTYYLDIDIF